MANRKELLVVSMMLLALALPACAKKECKKDKPKTKVERVDSVTYKKDKKEKKDKKGHKHDKGKKDTKSCR